MTPNSTEYRTCVGIDVSMAKLDVVTPADHATHTNGDQLGQPQGLLLILVGHRGVAFVVKRGNISINPLQINSTATAARTSPIRRVSTLMPVVPSF